MFSESDRGKPKSQGLASSLFRISVGMEHITNSKVWTLGAVSGPGDDQGMATSRYGPRGGRHFTRAYKGWRHRRTPVDKATVLVFRKPKEVSGMP